MLNYFNILLLIKIQYYLHYLWKFQNNTFGIVQNTIYLKRLSLQLWTFFEKFSFLFKSFVKAELS